MSGLLIIVALFGLMWFLMIRPQRAKAQQQQRMIAAVEPGDEILTVGGLYGIVQELEPEEEGGDLVVEIAEGIHVRIARRSLATVVKPDDDDESEDDDEAEGDVDEAEGDVDEAGEPSAGVVEVKSEEETVSSPPADDPTTPERS